MILSVKSPASISIIADGDSKTSELLPAELAIVEEQSSPKRKLEFTLGRIAAHEALSDAGCTQTVAITRAASGAASWPSGFCGSISHCNLRAGPGSPERPVVAAAMVASTDKVKSCGIDIEYAIRPVTQAIEIRTCSAHELEWIHAQNGNQSLRLLQMISAKEALFKAIYPLTSVYFWFRDVELTWQESLQCFTAVLIRELTPRFHLGYVTNIRCQSVDELILCSLVIPSEGK